MLLLIGEGRCFSPLLWPRYWYQQQLGRCFCPLTLSRCILQVSRTSHQRKTSAKLAHASFEMRSPSGCKTKTKKGRLGYDRYMPHVHRYVSECLEAEKPRRPDCSSAHTRAIFRKEISINGGETAKAHRSSSCRPEGRTAIQCWRKSGGNGPDAFFRPLGGKPCVFASCRVPFQSIFHARSPTG